MAAGPTTLGRTS